MPVSGLVWVETVVTELFLNEYLLKILPQVLDYTCL